ncbi:GNAT family N-acetyltransferase [Bacillus sp. FJAT-27245]|uniref:GNAT family N-acetyltransferase n=1 Tax=Bacillus sp. FJAT-27245 TaxID=1684144 RepID=UPI0006A75EF6|nr:GNAT family N-acetyltransferase [Bacillus sp. FJAT-27245]
MTTNKTNEVPTTASLREIQIPEDYEQLADLLNLIEPGSTSAAMLENEDRQIPATSNLKLDENGLLAGFGRTRVIAETEDGQIIGYGACFRAPWVDPGQVGSIFCVHPDFRGQGVGEMILSYIEKWATDNKAAVLTSIVMDWIDGSLPFVKKRGFTTDAHIYDLELAINQFDITPYAETVEKAEKSGIRFLTLGDMPGEESERKLYELFAETAKDNPGQYGSVPPFEQWRNEFMPEDSSRNDWVFIAVEGEKLVGVTQLFSTKDEGVVYTNYTGVRKDYRGRGIAKALKLLSIHAALKEGAHTMTTDSEETNAPIQSINRSLGYLPGKGHYRIVKRIKEKLPN